MKQFEIWLANLDPSYGTEVGKTRPVLIVQNDFLNQYGHKSTLICPLTTNLTDGSTLLRTRIIKGQANLEKDLDVLIDQITAIDNRRFVANIGTIPPFLMVRVKQNLINIFDLND